MRVIGEKNNVYGAHVWNTYCPEQFEHSVCFINGGISGSTTQNPENIYTACVADKFHIGWLSNDTADFKLVNCYWYNKEVNGVSYQEGAYGFYIPTNVANSYGQNVEVGSNITAIDCYMVGSDLDNDTCFTNFCNINNNGIDFTGPITNVFHGPLKNLNGVALPEVQYGQIKSVAGTIENSNEEKFNVYRLTEENINRTTNLLFTGGVYMDTIESATSGRGTISNSFPTTTQIAIDNNDVEFIINANDTYTSSNYINMNLARLGYETNDVGVICFDYYTEAVGAEYRTKELLLNSLRIKDYFTEEGIGSIPLEDSSNGAYKTLAYMFKIAESTISSINISIGFGNRTGEKFEPNTSGTDFRKAISIKNLRIIKIPTTFNPNGLPRYYLETEENYRKRVAKAFSSKNSIITTKVVEGVSYDVFKIPEYNPSHPAYQRYSDSTLSYVSLPFKYSIKTLQSSNPAHPNNRYYMSYTSFGKPCFNQATNEEDVYYVGIEMNYSSNGHQKLFLTKDCVYNGTGDNTYMNICDTATRKNINLVGNNSLADFIFSENVVECTNTLMLLPSDTSKSYILTNLICNPYGYHFESPIDAKYDEFTNEPIELDVPLYANGEIRLAMKNAAYSTNLPTIFI